MDRRKFLQAMTATAAAATITGAVSDDVSAADKPAKKEKDSMKKLIIAADGFAIALKDAIVAHVKEQGYEVVDVGSTTTKDVPYWEGCTAACKLLQADPAARGLLFCGSGMGMSLIANRFKGVRASVVESVFAAKMCRSINDANVLCMGAMIWGEWMAKEAVDTFLKTKFTEGLEPLADFLQGAAKTVAAIDGK